MFQFSRLYSLVAIISMGPFLLSNRLSAQSRTFSIEFNTQVVGTSNDRVPFWMQANQYGSVPLSGKSSSLLGKFNRNFIAKNDTSARQNGFDWGIGIEARLNTNGKKNDLLISEGFLKARLHAFEMRVGRSKETMGLTGDTLLTSGSFAISGNALGIPQIDLRIPDFYRLTLFKRALSIKGNFSFGLVGKVPVREYKNVREAETYFHQKSFYAKLGRPEWKIALIGGFNHQAFWGNEATFLGPQFEMSPLESFYYVATGKARGGRGTGTERSKVGNHLGSIDAGVLADVGDLKLSFYRQNFYDVGALSHLSNFKDGLNGVSVGNLQFRIGSFRLEKILLEFMYSKNQAGEANSKITKSGDENYYNNYLYRDGWSYKARGLGTPLMTPKASSKGGFASDPVDYFINNRVIALHLGITGRCGDWTYMVKATKSENFGTFGTSPLGRSLGPKRIQPKYGFFKQASQFSSALQLQRELRGGFGVTAIAALDAGELLEQSAGALLMISKKL